MSKKWWLLARQAPYVVGATEMGGTRTASFGASKREGHDASAFYGRSMYEDHLPQLTVAGLQAVGPRPAPQISPDRSDWVDRVYCHTSEDMHHVPSSSVGLVFTSPPYNAGKEYDGDMSLEAYLGLIGRVASEVHRVLVPGGRYVVNVANLGRNPYIPLHAYFYAVHLGVGFRPMGEIIWRKSKGMNGNCAWGSWRSAKAPRLRDVHEYLLVFAKDVGARQDKGTSNISSEEFMDSTLSVWEIPPESARRVGHPAPFPVALAERVIKLFSYEEDVVLDPFVGSGTTCLAAKVLGRGYVGYDIEPSYCDMARTRLELDGNSAAARSGT